MKRNASAIALTKPIIAGAWVSAKSRRAAITSNWNDAPAPARRKAEPGIALLDRDEIVRLAERDGIALPAFQARCAHRRADQLLDAIVVLAEPLEREQLPH